MGKIIRGILSYLTNWKNLLTHALIGVGILAAALLLPVKPAARICILVAVVALNIVRMKLEKRKKPAPDTQGQAE